MCKVSEFVRYSLAVVRRSREPPRQGGGSTTRLGHYGGMASELTFTIWTDAPADRSLASRLAQRTVKEIQTSGCGTAAAVVAFDSVHLEPSDVHDAARVFAGISDDTEPKAQAKPRRRGKSKSE